MTIDERLEALAHSVELLAEYHRGIETAQRQTQKEIRRLARFARAILADRETRLLKLEAEEDEDGDESEGNGQGPSG
ncbi:MAG TPA: hypothetical protein VMI06_14735 [Terriglobia bacterium]|nr:hypothetical protein [Terriglobia bacterium]